MNAFQTILRTEGVRGLYRGFLLSFFTGIAGAALLAGYDKAMPSSTNSEMKKKKAEVLKA